MKLVRLSTLVVMMLALVGGVVLFAPGVSANAGGNAKCESDCAPADDSGATTTITGGTVSNTTTLDISVDGGVAIGDASGGDDNVAIIDTNGNGGDATVSSDGQIAAAGNGGTADASADGGSVAVGDINSGGNSGNTITVGDTGTAPQECDCAPKPEKPVVEKPVIEKPVVEKPVEAVKAPKVVEVMAAPKAAKVAVEAAPAAKGGEKAVKGLPSTGTGAVLGTAGANDALVVLAALGALGAAGYGLRRRFI
jgi:septal ring-binding cell division protein DamX